MKTGSSSDMQIRGLRSSLRQTQDVYGLHGACVAVPIQTDGLDLPCGSRAVPREAYDLIEVVDQTTVQQRGQITAIWCRLCAVSRSKQLVTARSPLMIASLSGTPGGGELAIPKGRGTNMRTGDSDPDYWQERYRSALKSLEEQGRETQELEHRLRKAVAQLAVAGQGSDRELSRHLEDIRTAAHGGATPDELFERITRMREHLRQHARSEAADQQPTQNPDHALRGLLERMGTLFGVSALDGEGTNAIGRRLAKADRGELIRLAERMQERMPVTLEGHGPAPADGRESSARTNAAAVDRQSLTVVNMLLDGLDRRLEPERVAYLRKELSEGGADATIPVCRQLVEEIEKAMGAAGKISPAKRTESAADDPADARAPRDLRDEVVPAGDDAIAASAASSRSGVNEQLHNRAERIIKVLRLPEELNQQADNLLRAIPAITDPESATVQCLEDLASLLEAYRAVSDRDRDALRQFLRTVLGRLTELEGLVGDEQQSREQSATVNRKLDVAVDDNLRALREAVENQGDLGAIGTAIGKHIARLNDQLSRRRKMESEAQRDAEERLSRVQERLQAMETEAQSLRDRLKKAESQSTTDELTGLGNRRAWQSRMRHEAERHRRYDHPLALILCDLDDFKLVNDQLGHQAGDSALVQVASLLRSTLRSTDFIARYGGEELVVLLPETDLDAAHILAEKLRQAVREQGFEFEGVQYRLTASFGVGQLASAEPPEQAFKRVDDAVYVAKAEGRDRVSTAAPPESNRESGNEVQSPAPDRPDQESDE